jgi:hypothetical protein
MPKIINYISKRRSRKRTEEDIIRKTDYKRNKIRICYKTAVLLSVDYMGLVRARLEELSVLRGLCIQCFCI